jgi:hypothetical protein
MTQPRDPDTIIATWLDDGPIDLPDETRRAIVVGLRTQPRARQVAILRGLPVNSLSRFATAAVVLLAVGALSIFILSNRGGGPGGLPPPSVAPSASPAAIASRSPSVAPTASPVSTAGWVAFSSSRYGYQIARPSTYRATPATRGWVFATDRLDDTTTAADEFIDPAASYQIRLTAWAVDVPIGTSEDAWIAAYYQADPTPSCRVNVDALVPIIVDGHPGRKGIGACSDSQVFVFFDGRVHVFAIWRDSQEPLLDAFLSTVRFQSSAPSGSPGPS